MEDKNATGRRKPLFALISYGLTVSILVCTVCKPTKPIEGSTQICSLEFARQHAINSFVKQNRINDFEIKASEDSTEYSIYFFPKNGISTEGEWTLIKRGGDTNYYYDKRTCELKKVVKGQ